VVKGEEVLTHVVGVDGVAAFVCGLLDAVLHDVEDTGAAHIHIVLSLPSIETSSKIRL
jgi:hypothetical protein